MVRFLAAGNDEGSGGECPGRFLASPVCAGDLGGSGLLGDLAGADFYTTETGVPLPDRGDDKTTLTGTKGGATGAGVFIDRNA